MAGSLERLLEALKRMRNADDPSPQSACQLREGVDLAVRLTDRLQQAANNRARRPPERLRPHGHFYLPFSA